MPHGNVQLNINSAMALLRQKADEISPEELPEMNQKMISLEIDKKLKISLVESLTEKRDKARIARIASIGLPLAEDWLNVIPSPILGLHARRSGILFFTG